MSRIVLYALLSVLLSASLYFALAAILIITDRPKKSPSPAARLAFDELRIDYRGLLAVNSFSARDGKQLDYRVYPSQSNKVVILLHGSGWHSRYFLPLAGYLSAGNLARVYTPDLRGHGRIPERRGDVDFLAMVRRDNPGALIVLGGHSSGGGLAIRFAGGRYGWQADAYLLLSPWLKYDAPIPIVSTPVMPLEITGRTLAPSRSPCSLLRAPPTKSSWLTGSSRSYVHWRRPTSQWCRV